LTKGKIWHVDEERVLRDLVNAGLSINEICDSMGKTRASIKSKLHDLGLSIKKLSSEEVASDISAFLEANEELPSIKETLQFQYAVRRALEQPGLPKSEIMRLQALMRSAKDYVKLYAEFVNYKTLEVKLEELSREMKKQVKPGEPGT
jgi:hypothetical protein